MPFQLLETWCISEFLAESKVPPFKFFCVFEGSRAKAQPAPNPGMHQSPVEVFPLDKARIPVSLVLFYEKGGLSISPSWDSIICPGGGGINICFNAFSHRKKTSPPPKFRRPLRCPPPLSRIVTSHFLGRKHLK